MNEEIAKQISEIKHNIAAIAQAAKNEKDRHDSIEQVFINDTMVLLNKFMTLTKMVYDEIDK